MRHTDIIVLNGTSSAGKTTIARAMQLISPEPYLRSGIDHFLDNMPARIMDDPHWCSMERDARGRLLQIALGPGARAFFAAIYRSIAEFASAGVSVIVEDVMYDYEAVRAATNAFAAFNPLLVAVRCRRDIALERERKRGDRLRGSAAAFYDLAHRFIDYDFELDSSDMDARYAAESILAARNAPRAAFRRLQRRFESGPPRPQDPISAAKRDDPF